MSITRAYVLGGRGNGDGRRRPGFISRCGHRDAADRGQPRVTELYQGHALGLTRLAYVMLGDRQAAEDVVQDAFCSLYRAWDRLADRDHVVGYLRVSVVNGCRSLIRRNGRIPRPPGPPPTPSAEAAALLGEEQRAAVAALRRLPARQREALVLRYYADLSQQEIARVMGVSPGTVKSTTARALAALGRMLQEDQ